MKFRNLQRFIIRHNCYDNRYGQKYGLHINDKRSGLYKFMHAGHVELSYWSSKYAIFEIIYWHYCNISIKVSGPTTPKWQYIHEHLWERSAFYMYGIDVTTPHNKIWLGDRRITKRITCSRDEFHSAHKYCMNYIRKYNQI